MHFNLKLTRKRLFKRKFLYSRKLTRRHRIAYYESDKKGDIRLITLMNLLQNVAQRHVAKQGWGIAVMAKQSRAWMTTKYAIRVIKCPRVNEKIVISTWISELSKIAAIREFLVTDERGNTLIEAVSKWVLVDAVQKSFLEIPLMPQMKKHLFTTSFSHGGVKREDFVKTFSVCYDNIDFNQHVNNAFYPLWASESVSREFRMNHSPGEIVISFKKEALYGEDITVVTQIDDLKTTHLISSGDGREHARVTIKWKKDNALTTL